MTLSPGARLGPYEIISPLGAGGMGEVYRARDSRLERTVALKVLPEEFFEDKERSARFEREAKLLAAVNHPNIAAIHSFEEISGRHLLVMEFLEGTTLRDKLDVRPIPPKQAIDYALQIAKGLSAAHEKGIVHRDLKPENIFVTKGGHLKILDFGLAKRSEQEKTANETSAPTESKHTEPGTVIGTVVYMSPEQVRGLPVDHRSDIFSFGTILYELLSGKKAFKRDSVSETMAAIMRDEPRELSESGRSVPPSLDHIVKHCLEKSREDRFQSAKDIVFALSEASAPVVASGSREVFAPRASKRNSLLLVAASILVLLGIGAAILLNRRPRAEAPATAPGHSIAVLPFTNLSDDKNQEYFSDGLSEELRELLTKVKELRVVGRTSSFAFKGKTEDLASIGQKLHVAAVLEGSVRRAGDQLRVSTQLVNVADGYQIWAETYDRKMTDVFAVQDEIAGAVVGALKVKLLPQKSPAASQHRTSNPEAYNQYLLGRQFSSRQNIEGFRRAAGAYQKAIELDPSYAAAYADLAVAEFEISERETGAAQAEGRQKALAAAEKAIALDRDLAEGYSARGQLRFWISWDWAGAQSDFQRALSQDSGDSNTLNNHSLLLSAVGRLPEAIAATRKATSLDPLSASAWHRLGFHLNASGQLPEARKAFLRALEINPEKDLVHFDFGVTSLLGRDPRAALAEFRQEPFDVLRLAGVAMAEHDLGHATESQQALEQLIAKEAQIAAYQIAEMYAWCSEREKAFEWLDRACAQRDAGISYIKSDPLLAKLHGDMRHAALLKRMNLPPDK